MPGAGAGDTPDGGTDARFVTLSGELLIDLDGEWTAPVSWLEWEPLTKAARDVIAVVQGLW